MIVSILLALPMLAVPAQDTFKEQVKQYQEILDGRDGVGDAIALIDQFTQRYAQLSERLIEIADSLEIDEGDAKTLKKEAKKIKADQEDLADLVWLAFKERKRDTEDHRQLWKAAVFAFGGMGEGGSKYLWKAFEDKRFRKDLEFRAMCVVQVGHTKDYSQVEDLVDLLDYHLDLVIAKAAEALAQYRDAPAKVRLLAADKLVNFLNSYYNAQLNPDDTIGRQRYRLVRRPMLEALTELTGQSFQDPLEWRRWFNKNKKNKKVWSDD
jgi:HEAT repeat protein